jgi:hypothetical protein
MCSPRRLHGSTALSTVYPAIWRSPIPYQRRAWHGVVVSVPQAAIIIIMALATACSISAPVGDLDKAASAPIAHLDLDLDLDLDLTERERERELDKYASPVPA